MVEPITKLTEKELQGKKVLLRVDFNVPIKNGKIKEVYRIKANKDTINFLASRGAIIGLVSHITAMDSFKSVSNQIGTITGRHLFFLDDCIGSDININLKNAKNGSIFLLENIRKYKAEEKNDYEFAKKIAEPFDIYINNAFSESHRNYASVAAITKFLPSYAGLLMLKEIKNLDRILKLPSKNKTLIIGGAKIETKFPVIKNFINKSENILVGGAVANIFLKILGINIKKSLTDDKFLSVAKKLLKNPKIKLPEDYIFENSMILDIGPKTIEKFCQIIKKSKVIVWNGPLGKSEVLKLARGTKKIAKSVISSGAFSVVGGGDTIAFLEKINLIDKFNYVSTGGGAMLEFLSGKKLPGLKALNYYVS